MIYEDTLIGSSRNILIFRNEYPFFQDQVQIQVPDWKLVLTGNFIIEGNTNPICCEGRNFHGLPLEESSEELFEHTTIHRFKGYGRGYGNHRFLLHDVDTLEDNLKFTIIPVFYGVEKFST